uniref:Nondiscriminating glutamyl-tRNA synthetase EARS2, mitochondrial n=2 Tax=Lygus hesperus TaxID=30085 RepID=A0A0A9WEI0_LYGHE
MNVCKVLLRSSRFYSSRAGVRVRFAPSPTGLLHLGGLRTALYNFLFAQSKKGVFILRIEDTDQDRLVPGATQQLIEDLEWAGVHPHEGPTSGGDYGPYFQSERIHIYREEVEKLLKHNAAYYCFCSENRLELLRKDAVRNRKVPKYDNHCRHLSSAEVKAKLATGASKCIRFKLVPSEPYTDLVYGRINHDVHEIEGDPIILKTDGWPTYHLANVVDDHMMDISHVIRGVEWMPSTSKHLMIYKAFGYEPPLFGHIPLLLNSDGTKLSKRQGDLSIKALREEGILPRALVNFVLQAGSGFDSQVNNTSSMEDLISTFQIEKVSTNSCRLPFSKLPDFNRSDWSAGSVTRMIGSNW